MSPYTPFPEGHRQPSSGRPESPSPSAARGGGGAGNLPALLVAALAYVGALIGSVSRPAVIWVLLLVALGGLVAVLLWRLEDAL